MMVVVGEGNRRASNARYDEMKQNVRPADVRNAKNKLSAKMLGKLSSKL